MKNNIKTESKAANGSTDLPIVGLVCSSTDLRDVFKAAKIGKWHHGTFASKLLQVIMEDEARGESKVYQLIVMSNSAERKLGGSCAKAIITTLKGKPTDGDFTANWPSDPHKKYKMEVVFGDDVKVVPASAVRKQLDTITEITGVTYNNNPRGMIYLNHKMSF